MAGEKVKAYSGQNHVQNLTPGELSERAAKAGKYAGKEGVVSIDVWFALRGHSRSSVMQAAMKAFTTVRLATPEDWDAIFSKF